MSTCVVRRMHPLPWVRHTCKYMRITKSKQYPNLWWQLCFLHHLDPLDLPWHQSSLSFTYNLRTCRSPIPFYLLHLSTITTADFLYTEIEFGDIYPKGGLSGKEFTCQCRTSGFNPCVRKIPWRRKRQPTPVFLYGEFHGKRGLVGYSPKELDMVGNWACMH